MSVYFIFRIREHMNLREKDTIEDRKEGEELKKLGIQYHLEKERLESIKIDEKQQLKIDNMNQIRDRSTIKDMQQRQEEVIQCFHE